MNEEQKYFDLAQPTDREAFADYVRKIAKTWSENFEEGGGGDGEPYDDGVDLWVDIVERWEEDYYSLDVVSSLPEADIIGEAVCTVVVAELIAKRDEQEGGSNG